METSRNQYAIAGGAGLLLLLVFLGYLSWLSHQPPVLSRSAEVDPLSNIPISIKLNPLRDRASERAAAVYLKAMRDGRCKEQLADWEKDYHKKYAAFICDSEAKHPLLKWTIVDWEDNPPLRILHYRGTRNNLEQGGTYNEDFSVTLDNQDGPWVVTKYDAMY